MNTQLLHLDSNYSTYTPLIENSSSYGNSSYNTSDIDTGKSTFDTTFTLNKSI